MLDSSAFSFAPFAGQAQGFYTPTPGGMNTVYHNPAAGDLHTPGVPFHLGTPLSMPLPESGLHAGAPFEAQGFHPHMFQNNTFQNQPQYPQHQQTYHANLLVHEDSGYAAVDGSPDNELDLGSSVSKDLHMMPESSQRAERRMHAPPLPSEDR